MKIQQAMLAGHRRDYCGGVLMFAIGLLASVYGARYDVGSLTRMGPGFFPVCLGFILSLTGAAIAVAGKLSVAAEESVARPPDWRAWAYIAVSVVAFVIVGKYGGLLPATFSVVFISALADRQNTLRSALILAVSMVLIAAVVFWWALKLQFPLFAWG